MWLVCWRASDAGSMETTRNDDAKGPKSFEELLDKSSMLAVIEKLLLVRSGR